MSPALRPALQIRAYAKDQSLTAKVLQVGHVAHELYQVSEASKVHVVYMDGVDARGEDSWCTRKKGMDRAYRGAALS